LIAASLSIAASGCSRAPEPKAASHPPALDLVCLPEPVALTDEEVMADVDGSRDDRFKAEAIIAGRACRDALARVCQWHRDRGAEQPERCRNP
jgi:hypothetical protein